MAIFSSMYFGGDTGENDWVSESSKTTTTTEFFTSWTEMRGAGVCVRFLFCFPVRVLYIFSSSADPDSR